MRVTVISTDDKEAVLVRGTSALGIRGTFGCPLVVGEVIFIPSRGFEDNLRAGKSIDAEPGYESLSDIAILPAGTQETIQPAAEPGDYAIQCRVLSVVAAGDVRVGIRGFVVAIDRRDLQGLIPKVDDGLKFTMHRLSLWDKA